MSVYYDEIVPFYIKAGIDSSWKLQDVLTKLLNFQPTEEKRNFFKNNWEVERNCVNRARRFHNRKNFRDPVEDYVSVNTPQGKYLKVDNTLYPKCPKCRGRLYPSFKYCPYCSFDCNKLPSGSSRDTIQLNKTELMERPSKSFVRMRSKDKIEASTDEVIFDEDGMKVFESELKNASKDKRNLEQ